MYRPTKTQVETWRKLTPKWLGPAKVLSAIDGRYELQDLLSKDLHIRDSTDIKKFNLGVNPLLLNSLDSKLEPMIQILTHKPVNHKKSHNKRDLQFEVLVLKPDGSKGTAHYGYDQLKDRLLFMPYCRNNNLSHLLIEKSRRKPPTDKF